MSPDFDELSRRAPAVFTVDVDTMSKSYVTRPRIEDLRLSMEIIMIVRSTA